MKTLPDHAALDGRRFFRDLDRLHVEKDGMLLVGLRLRQQRMEEDATARVDEEGVRQLTETKVDDLTEERVHRDVDTRHALKLAEREHRQAAGRYHSCTQINQQRAVTNVIYLFIYLSHHN